MEFLNKVEIKGIVGAIRSAEYVPHTTCHNFSVVTEYQSNTKGGPSVIETTWWGCIAWSDKTPAVVLMEKGDKVHIIGRLRQNRYTTDGIQTHTATEIVVQSLEILED